MTRGAGHVSGIRARNILFAIIGLIAVAAVFTLVFTGRLMAAMQQPGDDLDSRDTADHFIVVTGTWADRAIVEQVYRGVQSAAADLHCAVELRTPDTFAQNVPLSSLLEYAAFSCADGVIIVNSDESLILEPLTDVHGNSIPCVTVGQWSQFNTEISCISSNYYSMGKTVSHALLSRNTDTLLVLADSANAHIGVDSLLSGIREAYNDEGKTLTVEVTALQTEGTLFTIDDQLHTILSATPANAILCLTPELTALTAQSVIDTSRTGSFSVLGLYENEQALEYLKKGIVQAIITPDTEMMGQYAIQEMASYLETGYANSYRRGTMQLLEAPYAP